MGIETEEVSISKCAFTIVSIVKKRKKKICPNLISVKNRRKINTLSDDYLRVCPAKGRTLPYSPGRLIQRDPFRFPRVEKTDLLARTLTQPSSFLPASPCNHPRRIQAGNQMRQIKCTPPPPLCIRVRTCDAASTNRPAAAHHPRISNRVG